mgnify:CR=1 FL=1
MAKPSLSERLDISEQLEGMGDDRLLKPVDDGDIIRTAEIISNSHHMQEIIRGMHSEFGKNVLWIADYSFGIREIDSKAVKVGEIVDSDSDDEDVCALTGYHIDTVNSVTLGSATSGAKIDFKRSPMIDGNFGARFIEGTKPSHMYRRIFMALGSEALYDSDFKENMWKLDENEFKSYLND